MSDNAPLIVISILFILFLAAFLAPRIFITVPAGHEAVLFRRFLNGTEVNQSYKEGLRLFLPWDTVTIYNLREQLLTQEVDALTSDGLNVKIQVMVRFQPKPRLLGTLHKEHGPDYVTTFLAPEVESATRHVIGLGKPAELYSTTRDLIERNIARKLHNELRQFEEFEDRPWPQPPDSMLYRYPDTSLARPEDNPHIRLILKHLYESGEASAALTDTLSKVGFVNLFEGLSQTEQEIEQADIYYKSLIHEAEEEIKVIERSLEMHRIRDETEEVKKKKEALRVLQDSSITVYEDLIVKIADDFKEGSAAFSTLKAAYDHFFMSIELKDVLISSIVLPRKIKDAIQSKLHQEQVAEEFDYRLERERKEAERKRIEARGIRDFQDMVAAGIEEGLLKWKAIEATLELAKSQNAKMIVIGAGKDGLPIILGNQGWDFPKSDTSAAMSR